MYAVHFERWDLENVVYADKILLTPSKAGGNRFVLDVRTKDNNHYLWVNVRVVEIDQDSILVEYDSIENGIAEVSIPRQISLVRVQPWWVRLNSWLAGS